MDKIKMPLELVNEEDGWVDINTIEDDFITIGYYYIS